MNSVNAVADPHVVQLMETGWRGIRRALEERILARVNGGDTRLRTSHLRLLALTPVEGMRVTDLAARASMTKQALGEFVTQLSATGHLEVVADERDRRVRIVRPTAAGRDLQQLIAASIAALEQDWSSQVGPRRWATFRAVLNEIGSSTNA